MEVFLIPIEIKFEKVSKFFKGKSGSIVTAVDNVSEEFDSNKIYAIVGESGSGKTTLGKMAVGLTFADKGNVVLKEKNLKKMRDKDIFVEAQYIHQDPYGSLDPYLTVGEILGRPLHYLLDIKNKDERYQRVSEMLQKSGLNEEYYSRTTQELSGGEKQRVLIARAFIINPGLVVADEPTTMIDYIHRNEILSLILNLNKSTKNTTIIISHDISVADAVSSEIKVMYKGRIVESGIKDEIIKNPLHPYTQLLLSVSPEELTKQSEGKVPEIDKKLFPRHALVREIKRGCNYSDVCPFAFSKCFEDSPELVGTDNHKVACFLHS